MILPGQMIYAHEPPLIVPTKPRTLHKESGMTFGVGPAGYDVRIAENIRLAPGSFALASTIERFQMPDNILATVHDKSSWARKGLAVQTTVIEPGWRGYLTLELTNHGYSAIDLAEGMPIAQILFHQLVEAASSPYAGKYQDQMAGPQPTIFEK